MKLHDLRVMCGDGEGYIRLTVPHRTSNGYTVRLLGTAGPRGVVEGVTTDGHSEVRFHKRVMIRWIDQQEKMGRHEVRF
jgi:hypothetical protein